MQKGSDINRHGYERTVRLHSLYMAVFLCCHVFGSAGNLRLAPAQNAWRQAVHLCLPVRGPVCGWFGNVICSPGPGNQDLLVQIPGSLVYPYCDSSDLLHPGIHLAWALADTTKSTPAFPPMFSGSRDDPDKRTQSTDMAQF